MFASGGDTPAPPKPVAPAKTPGAAMTPGAEVKVGDTASTDATGATPTYSGFTEKRVFGKPLGGLGKGGLGL